MKRSKFVIREAHLEVAVQIVCRMAEQRKCIKEDIYYYYYLYLEIVFQNNEFCVKTKLKTV